MSLRNWLPALAWLGELRHIGTLRADVVAGLTVALVLIPQSMAYAQLAGLPAQHGLYAAFLPCIVAALFGSSHQLATGPVAIVSLMSVASIAELQPGTPEQFLAWSLTLALLVGILQITLGAFRLGVLVNFLSHPVVMGFTNAAALIIASSQLGKLFGVSIEPGDYHYITVARILRGISEATDWPTLALGLLALAIMLLLRRYAPKAPGVLIAALATTLLAWLTGFAESGGAVVGHVPEGLPELGLPSVEFRIVLDLFAPALAIALIGFIEAISVAKATAVQTRQRLDASQELIGQGLANLVAAASSGYTVSGSFSRTALNFISGARTGFAGLVTGLGVGATLLWLTPLLYHLPQSTLAAIIIVAVIKLIRIQPLIEAWRMQPHDAVASLATFAITLLTAPHLDTGIFAGLLLSIGFYLYRGLHPRTELLSRHPDGRLRRADVHGLATCDEIAVLRFSAPLYFANAAFFESQLLELHQAQPMLKFMVVDISGVAEIDATGRDTLLAAQRDLEQEGVTLLLVGAREDLLDEMRRSGLFEELGSSTFFRQYDHALAYAWSHLPDNHRENCPLWRSRKRAGNGSGNSESKPDDETQITP
jgi:SulP family sulfate permease